MAPASGARGMLAALRHRNFRLFYLGQLVSLSGSWMQSTAQGWLVLELTDSELLLGVVAAASSIPVLLFTLYAGVVADRTDKRTILIVAQAAALLLALVLAVLTDTGRITVAGIIGIAFLTGTTAAFEIPTRQSFFVELVGKADLSNAIALNSSAFNATRIVGPAVAGALIGTVGIAACFYANAISFLAVLAGLVAIRTTGPRPSKPTASAASHLREGFRYIRGQRLVRALVFLVGTMSITAFPYWVLLPAFARDVLEVGAQGLGWLLAASGSGALAGGMALAAFGARIHRGRLLLASSMAFAVSVVGFALSRSFELSLVLVAAAGFAMLLSTATINALLQSIIPDHLRGRVMSVYVFMFLGMMPIGSLQAGALARWVGPSAAVAIGASCLVVALSAFATMVPDVRRMR